MVGIAIIVRAVILAAAVTGLVFAGRPWDARGWSAPLLVSLSRKLSWEFAQRHTWELIRGWGQLCSFCRRLRAGNPSFATLERYATKDALRGFWGLGHSTLAGEFANVAERIGRIAGFLWSATWFVRSDGGRAPMGSGFLPGGREFWSRGGEF